MKLVECKLWNTETTMFINPQYVMTVERTGYEPAATAVTMEGGLVHIIAGTPTEFVLAINARKERKANGD